MWVLGTKLGSSARAVNAPNQGAISPTPVVIFKSENMKHLPSLAHDSDWQWWWFVELSSPYGYMSELLTWFGGCVKVECSEPAVSLAADAVSGLSESKDISTKTWL